MGLLYQRAGKKDLDLLANTRIRMLRAANRLDDDVGMSWMRRESYEYYAKSPGDRIHCAYLIFDKDRFVEAGGVSFYRVMPTYHNPTGWKAYIMNMYTHPEYRRKGIALHILDLLVKEVGQAGIGFISLETTKMGRPLYERYGFVKMNDEMALPL